MGWKITYLKQAHRDLQRLDHSQLLQVFKAIKKVAENPLPKNEGGYGSPLGNNSLTKLAGLLKIKLKKTGIRVVYKLDKNNETMVIIVVSPRADNEVYKEAQKR
ncbi:MAG TPA: type II toxin-antitoxin system RelE/ParE family toxin [Clostridia bacterium]|nr:type II toxin-antitoxin system RelE/ParE family toxin [Clostridia bacterium]HPQ47188.1 type II toxin-antitoxin system RelE/ParE family toxin [Clostridia bacterium]